MSRRLRIGLFGLLGQGNLGNDGSLEAVLAHLRARHPDAELDFLCSGPDEVTRRHGLPAVRLNWNPREYLSPAGPRDLLAKAVGKVVDAARTAWWVSRHDAVIVPGMGVLESTLPLRPWGVSYSLFLACTAGRLFGTKVALVGVGADHIASPATRRLVTWAARQAAYRSFRDELSRDALSAMGVDTTRDSVCPDLVFALPHPDGPDAAADMIGLGVMDYHGGNEDRDHADEMHATYVSGIVRFAGWLVDGDLRVRVLTGDHGDTPVAHAVVAAVRADRPDLDEQAITAASITGLDDLIAEIDQVDTVIATRFHNIVCSVKLAKPTISVGYAAKNDVLMASMGLGDYCQAIRSLDVDLLIEQFTALRSRGASMREAMRLQVKANAALLDEQFDQLSEFIG